MQLHFFSTKSSRHANDLVISLKTTAPTFFLSSCFPASGSSSSLSFFSSCFFPDFVLFASSLITTDFLLSSSCLNVSLRRESLLPSLLSLFSRTTKSRSRLVTRSRFGGDLVDLESPSSTSDSPSLLDSSFSVAVI